MYWTWKLERRWQYCEKQQHRCPSWSPLVDQGSQIYQQCQWQLIQPLSKQTEGSALTRNGKMKGDDQSWMIADLIWFVWLVFARKNGQNWSLLVLDFCLIMLIAFPHLLWLTHRYWRKTALNCHTASTDLTLQSVSYRIRAEMAYNL